MLLIGNSIEYFSYKYEDFNYSYMGFVSVRYIN